MSDDGVLPVEVLTARVKAYHSAADVDMIGRAYALSEKAHRGQLRKSGDPYFIHPSHVAGIITELKLDASSVCAALLHDVVEDTDVTTEELARDFGEEVAFLVDGVTKLGKMNFASKEDRQAESFRKMLIAMARDIRVLLVKLADRLDNMRTLEHMNVDSQERIAQETLDIFAPLAGRLGIHWVKAELEDRSFQYLQPEAYAELERKSGASELGTKEYIAEVTGRLRDMLVSRGFALEVNGRQKHLYSIYGKMTQSNIDFEQVQDFVAFRCIMETVSDCYAALGVVHSEWTPIPGRFKDFIALPKANLYQSLHTTVIGPKGRRMEVQIRTLEMHRTAELGIAAHWKYKNQGGGLDERDAAKFAWLRQLMEAQQELDDPTDFFESVKVDLFPEDVYVFTPKGDVKTFPRGASAIDFAYAVHSQVGDHCTGARINGVIVPLRHKLRNGDVVEILTGKNQQPSKDWLSSVVTTKARSRIRAHFRQKERVRAVKIGRDLMERAMHKENLSYGRWLKSGEAKKVMAELGSHNEEEFFAEIGYGKLSTQRVIQMVTPSEPVERKSLAPTLLEKTVRKVTGKDAGATILIEGMDDLLVRFGKCCTPVPGDPIIGWITRGRGVTVHRRECPRGMELDPQRKIAVSWSTDAKMELPVSLKVITTNMPGILAKVSGVFTANGLNIQEAICKSGDDGRAINLFQFAIDDLSRLRSVMRHLSKIPGVQQVERV